MERAAADHASEASVSRLSPVQPVASVSASIDERSGVARALVESTKPGITRLVTITSVVGFLIAAVGLSWTAWSFAAALLACAVGTALSAAGANAMNQWAERERDAKMPRTAGRPIPSGRVRPESVLWMSVVLCVLGVGLLAAATGVASALVALACILSYILCYTPMKPASIFSTLVGAVPGALPPIIGWTAAAHAAGQDQWQALLAPGAWSLFVLMFVWQLPHFLAIAWMYREDYALGGFRVLPVVEAQKHKDAGESGAPVGRVTAITMFVTAILLIPATIAPVLALPDRLGWFSLSVAVVTGVAYVVLTGRVLRDPTPAAARRVFLASVMHLPLLLVCLVAEAVVRTLLF